MEETELKESQADGKEHDNAAVSMEVDEDQQAQEEEKGSIVTCATVALLLSAPSAPTLRTC